MKRYGLNKATEFTRKQINLAYRNAKQGNLKVEKWMMNRMYDLSDYYGTDDDGSIQKFEQRVKHILSLILEEDFENAQVQINNLTEWVFNSFTPKYQKRLDRNFI